MKRKPRLEHVLRRVLAMHGVRSRHVETDVARHHVYDAAGTGALPTIVLLPGLCDTAATHVSLLLRLRTRARRVLIIESAGHGLSGSASGEYTVARHLASICDVLDQLVDEPALLVGNSLGGATALRYARERPDRVCGLFLTSPGGAPFDASAAAHVRRSFSLATFSDAHAFVELVYHRKPRLSPLLALLLRARAGTAPEIRGILATLDTEHITADELAQLHVPTALVWGRSERLLAPSALAYFRAHAPAHVSITEPEGFGHCPHLDDPVRLTRLITAFATTATARDTSS